VDRIIYSIFQRFNLEWKTRTLNLFTQAAWRHHSNGFHSNGFHWLALTYRL